MSTYYSFHFRTYFVNICCLPGLPLAVVHVGVDHRQNAREDGERHKHPDILERCGNDQENPADHHAFSTEPVRVIPVIGIIQRPRNTEANRVIRLYRRQEVA